MTPLLWCHAALGALRRRVEMTKFREENRDKPTFSQMILDNLKVAGVQQAHKDGKITFTSLTPWPGGLICAEGRFSVDSREGRVESQRSLATDHSQLSTHHSPLTTENRAAIFIGPEFGTVTRPDLVSAARALIVIPTSSAREMRSQGFQPCFCQARMA
ncbi:MULTISPECIES: hypothetical protein [unclassified Thiocapsa]|uniref:hypothetical protein n=1 Tax=unclassified Thiocapsa TaxID=2641286 RepID=UPI0035B0B204